MHTPCKNICIQAWHQNEKYRQFKTNRKKNGKRKCIRHSKIYPLKHDIGKKNIGTSIDDDFLHEIENSGV
jgi:hypothetical protein